MKKLIFVLMACSTGWVNDSAAQSIPSGKDAVISEDKMSQLSDAAIGFAQAFLNIAADVLDDASREEVRNEFKSGLETLTQTFAAIDWNEAAGSSAAAVQQQVEEIDWAEIHRSLQEARGELKRAAGKLEKR